MKLLPYKVAPGAVLTLSLLLMCLTMVAGCGSRAPQLEPPAVKLVSLLVTDESDYTLDFRLSNVAARQMQVNQVTLTFSIDGHPLQPVTPDFAAMLPALGEELLTVSGQLPPSVTGPLRALTEGQRSQLRLQITGHVDHSDGQRFAVDQSSWLSATPGRPWQFR